MKKFIFWVIALIFLLASLDIAYEHFKDRSEYQAVTGPLQVQEGAKDPQFGVATKYPVLYREVSMLQYVQEKDSFGKKIAVKKSETKLVDLSVEDERTHWTYTNPSFPDLDGKEYFYGKVTIGENQVPLAGESLKPLLSNSYSYFATKEGKPAPYRRHFSAGKSAAAAWLYPNPGS